MHPNNQAVDSSGTTPSALPEQMRAVVQRGYGSADVLAVGTAELPTISSTQVLVAVQAAGVDRGTWHLMAGKPYLIRVLGFGLTTPKQPVPGLDLAGRVIEVGADVTRFSVGDEVLGIGSGAFAEYAVAEQDKLVHRPSDLSWEQAAVVPVSGITALQAVVDMGQVQEGHEVLILGASGGVGSYAVQIAKALGATVTGVASGAKQDLVSAIGADRVVDYTVHDVTEGSERYDVIIDTGGLTPLRRLRRILAPEGTLVIVGGEGGGPVTGGIGRQLLAMVTSPFVSQRLTSFVSKERHEAMQRVVEFVEAGSVVPVLDRVVPLDGVAAALSDLEAGRVRGKVAVRVRASD